jgi:hypothetical protein
MTPVAPAGTEPPPAKTRRRASAVEPAAPGRRRKPPGSPRGPVPRRVSGPVAAQALRPQTAPAERPRPRPRPAEPIQPRRSPADRRVRRSSKTRKQALSERLAAFLLSLPDHRLLDRLVRGRAWIPLLGVMLAGIVAVQVELLKLNASTGRSIELIGVLQGRNDVLRAQVAAASDPNRIERLASRMGMTMPSPESITFVRAGSASVRRALAGIHPPNLAAFEAALRASNVSSTSPSATAPPAQSGPSTTAQSGASATASTGPSTTAQSGASAAKPTGPSTGPSTTAQPSPSATASAGPSATAP